MPVFRNSRRSLLIRPSRGQAIHAYDSAEETRFWTSLAEAGLSLAESRVIENVIGRQGGQILTIGCGSGRESLALAKQGCVVVGIDLSRELLHEAAAHRGNLQDLHYGIADAVVLPFRDESLDQVVMITPMFGHISGARRRMSALVEAGRVLRPNGSILMSLYVGSIRDYSVSYLLWLLFHGRRNARPSNGEIKRRLPSRGVEKSRRVNHLAEVLVTMLRARFLRIRIAVRFIRLRVIRLGRGSLDGRDIYLHPRHYEVSMKPQPGLAFYHLYGMKEWFTDVRNAGLAIRDMYSIRELIMDRRLPSLLRNLDYLQFYVLRRPDV